MKFSTDKKARIMIVDDHPLVREGMAMLINREPDLFACCEAHHIEQVLDKNRSCPHDMVIVDMSLDGFSGLEVTRKLLLEFPDTPILMLSMHAESVYAEPALRAGARGYLMKQTATTELLQAIHLVLRGEMYVSDKMRTSLLKKAIGYSGIDSPVNNLSPGELEVLHLIGLGFGTADIADKIARSVKTVESHKASLKKKLNLDNANQLNLFAINFVSMNKL